MAGVARAVPPRASGGDDAADSALAPHPALERLGHRPDRGAALAGEDRVRAARVVGGHVVRGDVGGGGPSRGRQVDGAGGEPEPREAVADVGELGPLGVEGAGDEHLVAAPPVNEIAARRGGLPEERLGRGGPGARQPGLAVGRRRWLGRRYSCVYGYTYTCTYIIRNRPVQSRVPINSAACSRQYSMRAVLLQLQLPR